MRRVAFDVSVGRIGSAFFWPLLVASGSSSRPEKWLTVSLVGIVPIEPDAPLPFLNDLLIMTKFLGALVVKCSKLYAPKSLTYYRHTGKTVEIEADLPWNMDRLRT
jgi:hypothetical protein